MPEQLVVKRKASMTRKFCNKRITARPNKKCTNAAFVLMLNSLRSQVYES